MGGQSGEELDVAVPKAPCPAVRGEQDPERVVADDERDPEDAAELLAQGRGVGALSVGEAGVLEVALARQRAAGREHLAAEALPRLELDATHRRAHRPVDHLDPQPVGAQQHDVRDVDAEQPAGLAGHLVEHLAGVVEGGEPAGEVVEDGELLGATAQLGDRLRDVVVWLTHRPILTHPGTRAVGSGDDLPGVEHAVRVEGAADGAVHLDDGRATARPGGRRA